MKLFAVAGSPVSYSQSPQIWNHSFKKNNIDAHYFKISTDQAKDLIKMIKELELSGCNVTSPFKEDVIPYINKIEGDAVKIKSVNCIVPINKKLFGYNTDVDGFYSALVLNGFNPHNKKAIVIGAGGAARAVVHALMKSGASDIVIANRTFEKARELASDFKCRVSSIDKIEKETKEADLLVSCVSSIDRFISKDTFHKKLTVLDAQYAEVSCLQKDAEFAGCKLIDGREWLIYQAAFFFKDFFNELPLESMKEALKENIVKTYKNKKNISLIGFMGTGKSNLGKLLAQSNNSTFIDLDLIIEQKEGKSISDIFKDSGEEYFRKLENQALKTVDFSTPTVLACGGGTTINSDNVDLIRAGSKVLWLWSPLEEIKKRIDNTNRPLLNNAEIIFKERQTQYALACDICVNSKDEKGTLKQLLREIWI